MFINYQSCLNCAAGLDFMNFMKKYFSFFTGSMAFAFYTVRLVSWNIPCSLVMGLSEKI